MTPKADHNENEPGPGRSGSESGSLVLGLGLRVAVFGRGVRWLRGQLTHRRDTTERSKEPEPVSDGVATIAGRRLPDVAEVDGSKHLTRTSPASLNDRSFRRRVAVDVRVSRHDTGRCDRVGAASSIPHTPGALPIGFVRS